MLEEHDPTDSQISAESADIPKEIEDTGRLFPGYQILGLLGRGGMGTVYKARQIALDRLVAIKLLRIEISVNPDFAERFRQEAMAMARLNHPNILSVYDFGQTVEGHLYFVMEYVEGSSLFDLIHQVGLDLGQTLSVVEQICAALGFAHGKGVVHRDMKPANVMIDTESRVKVADFGLARLIEPNAEQVWAGTPEFVFGTPDYMAPEQMLDMAVDQRADIYSLGVMTYEMLCSEVPRGAFQLPSQRIGCDRRIDQIVIKAMQQSPDLRYQSTQEMAADIAAARTPLAPPRPSAAVPRPLGAVRAVGSPLPLRPVGPVRPRPYIPVPTPAQHGGGSHAGWVGIGIALCIAAVLLLHYAPWKETAPRTASRLEPAPTPVPAPVPTPVPTPTPATVTQTTPPPVPPSVVSAPDPPPSSDLPAVPTPQPQDEMKKWLADFDAQYQEGFQKQVTEPYEAGVADLRARYLAALDAGLAKVSAAGQLDQALVWRTERQDIAQAQTVGTDTTATPPAIRALRASFRQNFALIDQQRMARAKAFHASYDAILVKNITLLTQRKRLDDALLLTEKRKVLAQTLMGAEIQPPIQPEIQPPIQPPIQSESAKNALLDSTPVRKAMKCLEEALENVIPIAKEETSSYGSSFEYSDSKREAKLRAKKIVIDKLRAAQGELRLLKGSEAPDAKKTIEIALSSIPVKSYEQAPNDYRGTYSRPANNWNARATQSEIEKVIKQLTP